jgi:subtilisin family serine protease
MISASKETGRTIAELLQFRYTLDAAPLRSVHGFSSIAQVMFKSRTLRWWHNFQGEYSEMKRSINLTRTILALAVLATAAFAAPTLDSRLVSQINAAPLALTPVVITFNQRPTSSDLQMLQNLGIQGGYLMQQLPMVLTRVNQIQFNALKTKPAIRSLYANRTYRLFDREARTISGVENLIRDQVVTSMVGGLPASGKNIGVSYIDTGIDATHPDLQLGQNVAQNVYFATADVPLNLPAGFLPSLPVENQPMTDIEGGHGTFGAAITAGTGATPI